MFIKTLRAAGAGLAAIVLVNGQPLRAESSSDTARIEKLERAVEQLQKRNAELEQEVSSLKKHAAPVPAVAVKGKTKTQVTYDGKTYVEKSVPVEKSSEDKWKLSSSISEMELYGDIRLRYQYNGGRNGQHSSGPTRSGRRGNARLAGTRARAISSAPGPPRNASG